MCTINFRSRNKPVFMKNNKLKIIASTSMTIFSLATIFVATAAWFSATRNVGSKGDGFKVISYDGLVENISLYKQTEYSSSTAGGSSTYTYGQKIVNIDVDNSGKLNYTKPNNNDKMMDAYDGFSYQTPISVLVLVKINTAVAKSHSDGIQITPISTQTDSELKSNAEKLKAKDNSLSNILQFSYINIANKTDSNISFSTPEFILDGNNRKLESFMTTSSGDNGTVADYKSILSGNRYEYNSYKDQSGDSFYIGCIFEYNTTNIEYIYSINIANDAINLDNINSSLTYIQDFYFRIA